MLPEYLRAFVTPRRPLRVFKRVVLPAPDDPIMPTSSPAGAAPHTSLRIGTCTLFLCSSFLSTVTDIPEKVRLTASSGAIIFLSMSITTEESLCVRCFSSTPISAGTLSLLSTSPSLIDDEDDDEEEVSTWASSSRPFAISCSFMLFFAFFSLLPLDAFESLLSCDFLPPIPMLKSGCVLAPHSVLLLFLLTTDGLVFFSVDNSRLFVVLAFLPLFFSIVSGLS
mmetsp:Transcript_2141/g.4392  ORF Transcript_2141/g.4392 Transcript_2141/m.4392 type:complete len:224 (+) Transcript_2141:467-1138(+)